MKRVRQNGGSSLTNLVICYSGVQMWQRIVKSPGGKFPDTKEKLLAVVKIVQESKTFA